MHYEVLESEYIPLATVKKILKKRKKSELTYEQKMALENASEFARLNESATNKLIKSLKELEMRKLKDNFIIKIADMLPNTKEELLLILNTSKVSFKEDELKKILDIVKENVK